MQMANSLLIFFIKKRICGKAYKDNVHIFRVGFQIPRSRYSLLPLVARGVISLIRGFPQCLSRYDLSFQLALGECDYSSIIL